MNKFYGYVDFKEIESAFRCSDYYQKNILWLGGSEVNCYLVGSQNNKLKP